jgi:hypothetical protein
MAGNIFPLEATDVEGIVLTEVADDLEKVTNQLRNFVVQQGNTDQAHYDMQHIGDLYHAIRLIRSTLE